MPYVEEERKIKTKVIGVASAMDDSDKMRVRQVVLREMADAPEQVSILYLRQNEVYVSFDDGREFHLGNIKNKYRDILMNNVTQIVSWEITGGWLIPESTVMIAGTPTVKGGGSRAKLGLNIHISLL